jgi:hypothetical protein
MLNEYPSCYPKIFKHALSHRRVDAFARAYNDVNQHGAEKWMPVWDQMTKGCTLRFSVPEHILVTHAVIGRSMTIDDKLKAKQRFRRETVHNMQYPGTLGSWNKPGDDSWMVVDAGLLWVCPVPPNCSEPEEILRYETPYEEDAPSGEFTQRAVLEIDTSELLIISTSDQLHEFAKNYGIYSGNRIDWTEVASVEDAKGIIITVPMDEANDPPFYRSFCFPSGVLFDASCVTQVVAKRDV